MKKLVFIAGLLLASVCFGQYSGGGGGLSSATGVSGELAVYTGANTVAPAGVEPYDPDILIDMINTNALAIDDITGVNAVTVTTTSDALENGTNLLALVDAYSLAGTDMTIICPPADYTIPSTMVISNAVIRVICSDTPPMEWWKPKYFDHTVVPTQPLTPLCATITGDVTITADALLSEVAGFKIDGDVSAPHTDYNDSRTPSILRDCWVTGTIAQGENSSLYLDGVFCEGAVADSGGWCGNIDSSALLSSSGLDLIIINGTSSFNSRNTAIRNSWIRADACFAQVTGAKMIILNSIINGSGSFTDSTGVGGLTAVNTQFYGDGTGWDGVQDGVTSRFDYCLGISTNITSHSSTTFNYCSDSDGSVIP